MAHSRVFEHTQNCMQAEHKGDITIVALSTQEI